MLAKSSTHHHVILYLRRRECLKSKMDTRLQQQHIKWISCAERGCENEKNMLLISIPLKEVSKITFCQEETKAALGASQCEGSNQDSVQRCSTQHVFQ